jgi:hypothetical protein
MTRRKNDLYTTHSGLTKVLTNTISISCNTILEPCAGPGLMAKELKPFANFVFTNDIDPEFNTSYIGDASKPWATCWHKNYSWVVTNPPFNMATPILQNALECSTIGVAFLLRLTYLEPVKSRVELLSEYSDNMTHIIPVSGPRPNFRVGEINPKTGKKYGTDNATVAWIVWQHLWSWKDKGIDCPFKFATNWL